MQIKEVKEDKVVKIEEELKEQVKFIKGNEYEYLRVQESPFLALPSLDDDMKVSVLALGDLKARLFHVYILSFINKLHDT